MRRIPSIFLMALLLPGSLIRAREKVAEPKTQVKVNYLNVCNPSESDTKELIATLSRAPLKAHFAADFEVARGRSSVPDSGVKVDGADPAPPVDQIANWVRVRREYPADSSWISVQYSISMDSQSVLETLVFRSRELKDVIQLSLEDTVTGTADPLEVLKTDTPVDRIRIERFGKSSAVLARCPAADQKSYDAVFQQASQVLARYRALLAVRQTVPGDLQKLGSLTGIRETGTGKKTSQKPAAKPKAQ